MATADRTLMLKLIADVNQPQKQIKGLGSTLKRSASAVKSWGKAFTGALVIGGIEKVVDSLDDALAGFKEGEDAARRLGQTWKTLGRDTDQLGGIIDKLSESAINLGFDDAEVLTAFNTFLAKSGSVKDSLAGVQAAMNLARARGIPFATAVKKVSAQLGDLDGSLTRNKRQARIWARNHPLEVGLGKITDLWETFVGEFSRGRIQRAFAALGNIGGVIRDLLFGTIDENTGKRTEGLIDRFIEVGRRIVPAILSGLADLGAAILTWWNTEVATVDFAGTLGTAVANAVKLVSTNQDVITNLGITAVALATGIFVADIFANAAATMFKAPALIANAGLQLALKGLGVSLMLAIRFAMFIAQQAINFMATGLTFLISAIPVTTESTVGKAALGLGTAIQALIVTGVTVGLALAISAVLKDILDNLLPPGTRMRFNPDTGQMERFAAGGTSGGGFALVGEQGPELVNLPRGAQVFPADESAAMLGGVGGVINVHISAGVGDPVAIGREVDRVLRAYRGRAGLPA